MTFDDWYNVAALVAVFATIAFLKPIVGFIVGM